MNSWEMQGDNWKYSRIWSNPFLTLPEDTVNLKKGNYIISGNGKFRDLTWDGQVLCNNCGELTNKHYANREHLICWKCGKVFGPLPPVIKNKQEGIEIKQEVKNSIEQLEVT